MPKLNQGRSIQVEANLAKRIAYERGLRGLSYEALADAMTGVGCAINASSIYKIEKGDPPRRISVDELAALAEVFETPLPDLLVDMSLLNHRRAHELIEILGGLEEVVNGSVVQAVNALGELLDLAAVDSELAEYVDHHLEARRSSFEVTAETEIDDEAAEVAEAVRLQVARATFQLWRDLTDAARFLDSYQRGRWSPKLQELTRDLIQAIPEMMRAASAQDQLEKRIQEEALNGEH